MKAFGNYSIFRKILTGFLALSIMLLIVGGIGIAGMLQIKTMGASMYEKETAPVENLMYAVKSLYQMRVDARGAIIAAGDLQKIDSFEKSYLNSKDIFLRESAAYRESIDDAADLSLFDEAADLFHIEVAPTIEKTLDLARTEGQAAANAHLVTATDDVEKLFQNYDTLVDNQMSNAKSANNANSSTAALLTIILIFIAIIGMIGAVVLGIKISKMISDPIGRVAEASNSIALGHVDIDLSDIKTQDETGKLAGAFMKMLEGIRRQVKAAEGISRGDFTIEVPLRSEQDVLGLALSKIVKDLNQTMVLISAAAGQVNSGATQIAATAQALASGTTEQASTVEQLNSSIAHVAQQAAQNADHAQKATGYVNQAGIGVNESNAHMQKLNAAMRDIGESSEKISSITKVIEDIAFQTNILALNAAIEAARAGNAGKGFAVVADEVRNLAAKSAEAAKQTAELIEHSSSTVAGGEKLAAEAAMILKDVAEKERLVEQVIKDIDEASARQAGAIEQINQGLTQVSAVVQTNAASAEESSASSEEFAAQAQMLQNEIRKFKLQAESYTLDLGPEPSFTGTTQRTVLKNRLGKY